MTALISKGQQNKRGRDVPVLLGVELRDAREEVFTVLVCDGLPFGIAFRRAGFESKDHNAPSNLFNLPRVQDRAAAILKARRETGIVSLPEVTSMLRRVFAGANAAEEYSAAHNAAFSLARLYGHVTDKVSLDVIRRPSRDPDAPSELALASWVNDLPVIDHAPQDQNDVLGPLHSAPASLLGMPRDNPSTLSDNPAMPRDNLATPRDNPAMPRDNLATPRDSDVNANEINWLNRGTTPGQSENGAPVAPVTVTPTPRARSGLLVDGDTHPTPSRKEGLIGDEGTSTNTGESKIPGFKELFG